MKQLFWTIGQFPLFDYPTDRRLLDVPPGVVVEADPVGDLWSGITYAGRYGYCKTAYLEPYCQVFPGDVVVIENQTPSPYDAKQYYLLEGGVKHNACGELCICSITGDSMGQLSQKYKLAAPAWWRRLILKDSTTSLGDLEHILMSVYGTPPLQRLQPALTDAAGMRLTPGRLRSILVNYTVIVGVRISVADGYLARSGVAHWVAAREVAPNGVNGGTVQIYNPFTNAVEAYTWRDFQASVGVPAGLLVPPIKKES